MVSVGTGRYAVAADAVSRIMDPAQEADFRREAPAAEAVCGGARFPVVDLHSAVGQTPGPSCVYLVLEGGGGRVVVPVDSAEAIREVPAASIAPLPSFIFARDRRLFRGLFSDGRESRLLLDEGGLS